MAHVGVVFGGRSVEHQVSIVSARTVAQGLPDAGHQVTPLGIAQDGCWISTSAASEVLRGDTRAIAPIDMPVAPTLRHLLASGVEVLFPIVHGTWGEDGTLQGLCEMLDVAYVGPGVTASALAMDKLLSKRQLAAAGVPVVEYEAVSRAEFEGDPAAFLARAGGCRCRSSSSPASADRASACKRWSAPGPGGGGALRPALRRHGARRARGQGAGAGVRGPGLRHDRGVGRGRDRPRQRVLRLRRQVPAGHRPPDRPGRAAGDATERLRELAVAAFAAIGGSGMARVDFLLEGEDGLYVNEINTLPGFTSISMYPRLWGLSGVPLPKLVDRLVQIALERHRDRRRLDEGIKEWLAELAR